MQRGIVLHGNIRTSEGQPIPDAVVVWGDDPYRQPGSQEVRSDAEGLFRLAPLKPGPINLTVVASGWGPESRTVNVSALNESADFTLTKGNVLRIRFVDGDGIAIPNVSVGIRGWRGVSALYNYKHPNVLDTEIPSRANADGMYEWTWAPADAVDYYFGTKGFTAIDRTLVADGTEHIVKMEK